MAELRVRQLGLAAFVRMGGAVLLRVEGREFVFESPVALNEWRIDYNNSCCMKHDTLVCEMRHFLKASP